jgi:multiple sugar transport system permease protein
MRKTLLCWLLLLPLVVTTLFPFAVMFFTAVKPADEVLSAAPSWLPSRFAWENFPAMWSEAHFGTALLNSCLVSAASTLLVIIVSVPAAYGLARYRFHGRSQFQSFLLVTQMLSPIVLVLGLFKLVVQLHLLNSLAVVVVIYTAFNIPFGVWMLQSYFKSIPPDLEESAWLEGASRLRTIWDVFRPMAMPAITVTAIFTFIAAWNEFVIASTLLRDEDKFTLPIRVFSEGAGRYQILWHYVMAATFMATVPVAIVFSWFQRYLVTGLGAGAVK